MKNEISIIFIFNIIKMTLEIYNDGENWAVLACGSSGYINYRHQADVFHVYQSLIKRGFSKNHIILFAYDDIAYHPQNPFPGEIYNRPDGPNVYEGIIIDYTDNKVNPENYLSVLRGDTQNGKLKKVLNSTENDNIFLYFSDHGIAGALVFPQSQFLYADELEETFKIMKDKKMYKNIIFYLESCYSGSMFNNIDPNLNIYSMTAASPNEQSLATYCYPQDFVKGEEMHTCLSNEFTSNWLDDSDSRIIINENNRDNNNYLNNINENEKYSSHEQYIFVKNLTKNSNVQEYGNLSIGDLPITYFQSSNDAYKYIDNDNEGDDDKDDKKDKNKEKDEYEEIKRRIIEFGLDDDENDEEDFFNSYENIKNYFDEVKYDINSKKNNDNINNKKYNYINYIIYRNKYMKIEDKNNAKNKKYEKKNNILRGKNNKIKKIIKDTKYNLLSTYVKLFYLELDINQNKDAQKYIDFKKEIKEMEKSKNLFELLKIKLNIPDKIESNKKIDYKCLKFSIQLFKDECGIDERDLEYISLFSFECTKKDVNLHIIGDTIFELCKAKRDGLQL